MLPGLDENTSEGTEENLIIGRSEAVQIGAGAKSYFGFKVGLNFIEFIHRFGSILGKACKAAEGDSSISIATALDEPTGRLNGDRELGREQ